MTSGPSEAELRALVRDAIARHLRGPARPPEPDASGGHPSHVRLPLASGADGDGACLIEPAVRCRHCGYCLSYGH
jgi:hypothetical protein